MDTCTPAIEAEWGLRRLARSDGATEGEMKGEEWRGFEKGKEEGKEESKSEDEYSGRKMYVSNYNHDKKHKKWKVITPRAAHKAWRHLSQTSSNSILYQPIDISLLPLIKI